MKFKSRLRQFILDAACDWLDVSKGEGMVFGRDLGSRKGFTVRCDSNMGRARLFILSLKDC